MFISKALRRAEVFLEQVDESVAQASRRLVVEGATNVVNDDENDNAPSAEDQAQITRASAIPRAKLRPRPPLTSQVLDVPDAWGPDVDVSAALLSDKMPRPPSAGISDASSVDGESADLLLSEPAVENGEVHSVGDVQSSKEPISAVRPPSRSSSTSFPVVPRSKQDVAEPSAVVHEDDQYIAALKVESSELRKELELVESESRREKTKLVNNLKRMKNVVTEMDETLQEKSADARKLEAELVEAKDTVTVLTTTLKENEARAKDGLKSLGKDLNAKIESLQTQLAGISEERHSLVEENERLKQALLQGHEVELATADGARQEASQAHRAYESESAAHRETRKNAKEREEALEAEAALATNALAVAQRKAEDAGAAVSVAKAGQRAAEAKVATVTSARDAAFARISDLQNALQLFEGGDANEAPGQKEAKAMQQTVSELENALEAKNVELTRLEGEVEAWRMHTKTKRDAKSPRSPVQDGRNENGNLPEVEAKLRHMADSALRKQAQLEVLRSENRALQHQLNTERKRTREAQAMAAAASSSRQSIRGSFRGILESGEDDRGDRIYGVRDGPLARFRIPRNWPRVVAKVIGGLDRLSAQVLAFLRKEPLLRIVILLYLAAMHMLIYSLLHWHVDVVSGSLSSPHKTIASVKSTGQHVM